MTEDEARAHVAAFAGTSGMLKLERYAGFLLQENRRQNLISRASEPHIWQRHLLDSVQLANYIRAKDETLTDVGSGPGLPGIVLASLGRWHVCLVEPRRKRADFLVHLVDALDLEHVDVIAAGVQKVARRADIITARAVAPLAELFELTARCADEQTRYVLPKGRSAHSDVDLARARWHGVFHVEHSLTDQEAGIVIADRVTRR